MLNFDVPCPPSTSVDAALCDLRRDIEAACVDSTEGKKDMADWTLCIQRNTTLPNESFELEVHSDRRIVIEATDDLGVIYGIYEFSHRFLGVEPLWFWKELSPPQLKTFNPAPQRIESGEPRFRYRGLFINDEDLLARWREPSGERFQDWPRKEETLTRPATIQEDNYEWRLLGYYTPVISLETMEMIFEAVLRLRGNLMIPASFIDIFNKPEAAVVRAAVRRGLYVSQHHVEPLGVSHFAYESWWRRQGKSPAFSYLGDPESMRTTWKAYAEEWHRIAGDKIIWQLGLRGRGDRPMWDHDPAAAEHATRLFTDAFNDQVEIIREVDLREEPPATITLWLEVSQLMQAGKVNLPANVIRVFADDHMTQEMREDFHTLPRDPELTYGCYTHVAVWGCGPHLVQGISPSHILRIANEIAKKGDTEYAILNAANVREHALGVQCWFEQLWCTEPVSAEAFHDRAVSPALTDSYHEFFACIPELKPGWFLYDGYATQWINQLIRMHVTGESIRSDLQVFEGEWRGKLQEVVSASTVRQDRLLEALECTKCRWDDRYRKWLDFNLITQLRILRAQYECIRALSLKVPDVKRAQTALESIQETMRHSEQGRWLGWYRGDRKVGVSTQLNQLTALETQL